MLTLTPQARAIAAITLGFLLMTGSLGRVGVSVVALFGGDLSSRSHLQATLGVMIVVGIALLVFARRTAELADGWAEATAQAAQVLIVIGTAISVLSLIASALHGDQSGIYPYFAG